ADDSGLYWTDYDGTTGHVWLRTPGGTPTLLVGTAPVATGLPTRAGLDANALYYADNGGTVWQLSRSDGSATMIGTTDAGPGAVALDGAGGVWVATKHGAK